MKRSTAPVFQGSSSKGWLAALAVAMAASWASAAQVIRFEHAVNIDGTVYDSLQGDIFPGTVDLSAFDTTTGLGTLRVSLSGAGSRRVGLFVDHEIDENINTFYNEYGVAVGAPAGGLQWEIDEPGYMFGDIYSNFVAGLLQGTNGVPDTDPDDVSMALLWNFALADGQTGVAEFLIGTQLPTSGFYLQQTDPDSQASIYFSARLDLQSQGMPEPATAWLAAAALAALAGARRGAAHFKETP